MNRIVATFKNQLKVMKERNWEFIYIAVDFHGTLFKPDYEVLTDDKRDVDMYPVAAQVMRMLTEDSRFKLFTYTASYPEEINKYAKILDTNYGIKFDYYNENPEVRTEEQNWGNFDKKPYFNVLLDDKAGFDPHIDWKEILNFLEYKDEEGI